MKPHFLGILALAIATATVVPIVRASRGVRPVPLSVSTSTPSEPSRFDREQSAALFIGIRKFTHHETIDVPYAVDDAIDLAYMFALDRRVSLVPPRRVVLALSGHPQKQESRERLRQLQKAGARVENETGPADLLALLHRQAAMAGQDGILIVSLATHGFVREGVSYLLGASSLPRHPETALSTAKMLDVIAASAARRSLIFVDACRERVAGARSPAADPVSSPLSRRMASLDGQVVFYAGRYAYDDHTTRNGVFTKAILDGLDCKAAATRGIVTVETLRTFVERQVRTWIRKHRDPSIRSAIQVCLDGDTKNIPLSLCGKAEPMATPGAVHEVSNR